MPGTILCDFHSTRISRYEGHWACMDLATRGIRGSTTRSNDTNYIDRSKDQ